MTLASNITARRAAPSHHSLLMRLAVQLRTLCRTTLEAPRQSGRSRDDVETTPAPTEEVGAALRRQIENTDFSASGLGQLDAALRFRQRILGALPATSRDI